MTLSTDLGSVQAEGDVRVPSPDNIDILGPLVRAGEDAVEQIKEGRLEKLDQDFDTLADDAVTDAMQQRNDIVIEGPESTGNEQADALLGNIRTLQAGVDQATGSSRARLEMQLRKKAEELSKQFPSQRAAIATELARFERVDPEFQALHALDVRNAAFSKQQGIELGEIRDNAYGSIDSGGLGMDAGLMKFGTKEFAVEYTYRSNLQQKRNENQLVNETLQSNEDMSSRDRAASFQTWATGEGNVVEGMISSARASTDVVAAALRDITAPGASETLAAWNNGGKQATVQELQSAVFAIEDEFAKFPVNMQHTDSFKGAENLKKSQVSALNALIAGVTNDDPTVMQAYQAYETQMRIGFVRENPDFSRTARIMTDIAPVLDLVDADFGAQGDLLRNEIAGFLNQGLGPVLGRTFGFTQLDDLPPNASQAELQAHLRGIRTNNPNIYGNGQSDVRGTQTMAVTDSALRMDPSYLRMATENAVTPDIATKQMGTAASQTDQLILSGTVPPDAMQFHLEGWANEGIVDMARIARGSAQPGTGQLAADKMEELASDYEPVRRNRYEQLKFNVVTPGVTTQNVVFADQGKLDKGEVVFRVDEDRVRALINTPEFTQRTTGRFIPGVTEGDIQKALAEARLQAAELTRQVTLDLRWKAHVEAVQNGLDKPDYTAQWESGRFDQHFGALEDGGN